MSKTRVRVLLDTIIQLAGDNEIKRDIAAGYLQTLHFQLTEKVPYQFQASFFPQQSSPLNQSFPNQKINYY